MMIISRWQKWTRNILQPSRKRWPIRRRRLRLEQLEDRTLLSAQPDLTVLSASLGSGSAVVGNATSLPVTWTVKNQGTWAPTQNWTDSFYLSSKTTYDSSAVFVGSVYRNDPFPLAVGGSYTSSTNLTIPNATLSGKQNLLVITDQADTIGESNTTNNTFAVSLTLSAPSVNLAVSNPSVSSNNLVAGNGQSVSVSWTVTNNGSDPAQTTWFDTVYLSSKTTYDATAVYLGGFPSPHTLAAGASYTQTQNVTIPNTTLLGSEHLLFVANADSTQGESSTTGGTAVLNVNVSAPSNVDLEVVPGSITAPSSATLGQRIPVSWTVKNIGTSAADASWTDVVYSSPTATYSASTAHVLGSFAAPGTLAAGASYTQNQTVTLPAASAADHYLIVVTNAFNDQAETSSANDTGASPKVTLSEPSLAITAFTGPAKANLGDTITLDWTVKNTSPIATAASWSDSVYVSNSSTYDSSAQFLQSFAAPVAGSLAGGASYNQVEQVTLPYTQTGSRYLFLVADDGQGQPVSGTTPIVASEPIALGEPDLAVTLNSPPSSAVLGQAFNLSWTVKNTGGVAANAGWEDAVFVSSSANFDPVAATQVAAVNAPSALAAGASYTTTTTVVLPSMPAGNYYLFVVADRNNDQGKTNESTDNVTSQAISVTGPDLTVKINSASSTVVAGDGAQVAVSWTVTNNSTADAVATWYDTVLLSSTPTLNLNAPGTYWFLNSYARPGHGPLAAGASYTSGASVLVPNVKTAGTYYLFVVTDTPSYFDYYYYSNPSFSHPQAETNTGNDTASASVQVTLPNVTLAVQSVSVTPTPVVASGKAVVTWTVKNTGTDPAAGSWSDEVYLSSKQTLDSSAIPLTTYFYSRGNLPLAAGGTYTAADTVTIPGTTIAGTEYLLVAPDQLQEQAAVTSVFAQQVTVTVPDVKLSTKITSAPTSVALGQSVALSWTVTNNGTATTNAPLWTDDVYLSHSATYDSSAIWVGSLSPSNLNGQLPLAAGGSYSVNRNVTVPSYIAPGSYYLLVVADDPTAEDGVQAQSDASRSVASAAVTVTTATSNVDLVVSTASAPTSATVGTSIPVTFTVLNQGTDATTSSWGDAVYLSNSPTVNAASTLVTTIDNTTTLAGGGSYTVSQNITLPTKTGVGNRYLVFETDVFGEQAEVNRANDTYAVPITLSSPDLAVTAFSFTGGAVEGGTIAVSYTVKNQGAVAAHGPWTDGIFLSDTPTYDPQTAIFVGSVPLAAQATVAPQGTYSPTETVTLPAYTVGNRYLLLVADAYNNVEGPQRSDNVQAVPITLTAPNLAVSNVSATPATVEAGNGAHLSVTWTVTNTSSLPASAFWNDTAYLSQTATFDPSTAIQIASPYNQSTLAGGASYTHTESVPVPNEVPGTYYVFVVANSGYALSQPGYYTYSSQPESDPSDNVGAAANPVALTSPAVNLQAGTLTASRTTALPGQSLNVSFPVKNTGTETAAGSWSDAVYLSTTPTFNPVTAIQVARYLTTPTSLAANSSYTQSTSVTIPTDTSPGSYYLFGVTNDFQVQGETAYADDVTAAVPLTIDSLNLGVTINSAPSAAKLNDSVSVSYAVKNNAQDTIDFNWGDVVYLSDAQTFDSSAVQLMSKTITNSTSPLVPGGSYTVTANVTIPNGTTGQKYLLFVPDANDGSLFSFGTNTANLVAVPITLSAPQVNLQVVPGSVTAPASGEGGSSVSVSWLVKNAGADPANGPWQDAVYVSTKNTFDSSAQFLAEVAAPTASLPLAGGASYLQTSSVTLSTTLSGSFYPTPLAPGNYFLYVVANQDKGQSETNTADDVSDAVPITVTAPDLQVTNVSAPSSAVYGSTVQVSWTVQNTGTGVASGSWEDAVYVSTNSTFDSSAQLVTYFAENRTLAASATYTDTQNFTLTTNTPISGPVYVYVYTNANNPDNTNFYYGGYITESNYANDVSAPQQMTINAPQLAISVNSSPSSAKLNDTVSVSWTVTNQSTQYAAYESWDDVVYVSTRQTLDASAIQLDDLYIANSTPLAAQGSYNETDNLTIPANAPTGNVYLLFVTDAYDNQAQTDRSKDLVAVPITLSAPQVDLQVVPGSVSAPASANLGSDFTVSWSVQNNGSDPANGPWTDYIYLSQKNTFDSSAQYLASEPAPTPLAGNSSYSQTDNYVYVSGAAPGNYYLYVVTNADSGQSESNTTNDVSTAVPITITEPDLQVTSVTATPTSAVYGSSVSLSWTVQNTGTGTASSFWYDSVYVSTNSTFDSTARFLTEFAESQTVAPNASYTDTQNVTLSTVPPTSGPVYFYVVANDTEFGYHYLTESNYDNNTGGSSQVTVNVPDLAISVNSSPSSAKLNDTVPVSWTVTDNSQYSALAGWTDAVYLSTRQTLDSSAILLTSEQVTSLAGGNSYTETPNVTFPANAPTGNVYLLFVTDTSDHQAESNKANNLVAEPITLSVPQVNLQVVSGSVSGPGSTNVQSSFTVSWSIDNAGTDSAKGPWLDYVYLSTKNTFDSTAQFLGSFNVPSGKLPLAGGASYLQSSQSVTLPSSVTPGNYYLYVVADGNNGQAETSTTGGVSAAVPLTVTAPDLTVTGVTAPATGLYGSSISVSWTVDNTGVGTATGTWYDAVYVSSSPTFDSSAQLLTYYRENHTLATNATYTETESVSLTSYALSNPPITGTAYILVVTNSFEGLAESSYTNNADGSGAITLSAPDLTTTTASAPAHGVIGGSISVSWTVKNIGSVSALAQWEDDVYISSTNRLDSTAQFIASFAAPGTLAAGASYTQNHSITLPYTSTGSEYLLFVANGGDYQPETSTTNNTYAAPIDVSAADLTVTAVDPPPSITLGQPFTVSFTVKNVGTGPADQTWHDGIYLSTKPVFDGSATFLESVAVGGDSPLAAGASYTHTAQVTVGTGQPVGNYYILVYANYDGGQLEPNTNNNVGASQALWLDGPDLTVPSVTAPASAHFGDTVVVSWTVQNQGGRAATGGWTDGVYWSQNSTFDGTATLLQSVPVGNNSPLAGNGASYTESTEVSLPIGNQPKSGTYYLYVVADINDQVPEINNTNQVSPDQAIDLTLPPLPDLIVTGITPPPSGSLSGTSVPLSFTVKNNGTAPTSVPVWYDWVILSQDPTLGSTYQGTLNPTGPGGDQTLNNQPVVLGFPNPSYLDVGQSYTQTVDVPIPVSVQGGSPAGTWYVYVVPDGTGFHHPFSMPELSRTDKLDLSSGFNVALSPPPELVVSGVQAPPDPFSGQPMNLTWTVTNAGTGPTVTDSWTDAVYESSSSTFDSSAKLLATFRHQGVLAPNGSYTENETITLPVGVSGSFYFYVQTDFYGQVFQNGQTADNIEGTSAASDVQLTPPPDLQPTITALPASALASHSLTFTYQVTNNGAGGTPNNSWTDTYYLSPSQTFVAGQATLLGSQGHDGSLDAGASYTYTATVTLPDNISGNDYLIVDTDSGNQVFELSSDEGKKFGASAGTVQITSQPADLVLTTAGAPATGIAGDAVTVTWAVNNEGAGDTAVSSWRDAVYYDTIDGAHLIGTYTHDGLLSPGDSYTQSELVTLPVSLSGPHDLYVVADATQSVYQTSYASDTSHALPIAVTQQLADLQVLSVTAPTSAVTGGQIAVSWTVQNTGSGVTNSNYWYDDVWLSTNPTLQSGGTDVYLGTVQHSNALAAGASYTASLTVAVPQDLAAGNWYVIVATDRPVAPPGHGDGVDLVYQVSYADSQLSATSATAVSLGAVPDLTVTSVTAPATATSGGPLNLSWTVQNTGADTGNVTITDSVYLSFDQVLDPADRYIGSVTFTGDLAHDGTYTQTQGITLPSGLAGTYYVFVVTNSNGDVFERNTANNTAFAAQPLQINLPAPADLVAGTVTVPANAAAGQDITVTYQVTNNGTNAANGYWYDALYLSPTQTWSPSDPFLGRVYESQNLQPGDSYTGTLTAPLPGLTPGGYYVIVRSNILDTLPEVTLANNISASVTTSSIDAPALTLGTPTTGTLADGQSAFFKVVVAADQTLRINLTSQDAHSLNELYVSYGTMPTRGQYDYRFTALAPNQQITVPTTEAGSYYVLAYASSVPGAPESYSVNATLVPFSVQAVAPGTVGTGPVTVEIDGAKFDNGTTFQLLGANDAVIQGQQVYLQDSTTAFVKFDLTNAATGTYDVQATHADGTTTNLAQALSVVAATPAKVQYYLSAPQGILPGRQGTVTVNFINNGNTDALAPLLELTADYALLRLSDQSSFAGSAVTFLGTSDTGPAGVLRPGESGEVTIPFKAIGQVGQTIHFQVQVADDSQAIDWNSQKASLELPTIPAAAWDGVFANFVKNVGSTVGTYHTALAADATYLGQVASPTNDVLQLVKFEIEKANATYTAQTLASVTDDSLPAPGMDLVFQRSFQQSIAGRYTTGILGYGWTTNWDISAQTDASGNAVIQDNGITLYYFKQADGSYQPEPGDHSVLTLVNGAYRLVLTNGTVYQFNVTGTLRSVSDSNGNSITVGYNVAGQMVSLTDSNGESFTLTYNSHGHLSQLTDSNGLTETYGYDPTGQFLTTYTDGSGTTTYSYVTGQSPAQNNALSEIAFADNTHVFFSYDSEGRLTDQHQDGGAQDQTFTYLNPGGLTVTDGDGNKSTYLFNLYGATAETIDANGNLTRYVYDANQNLTEIDGPLGTKYAYSYDANGNLATITDALGNVTRFTYDASGDLLSYTDAKGNTTAYSYSASRNLMSVTYANGQEQQYSYNPLGEATQYLNARGHAIGFTYNAQGLVTKESFADGTSYTFTYDDRGNLLTATDGHSDVTTFSYADPNNPDLLTKVSYPDGTFLQFTYNVTGQRTQSVDQTGYTVNYTYDAVGRLQKLTDGQGNLIVQYTYDRAGRLTQKDMGNGTRTVYTYDGDGNVVKIVNLAPDHTTVNSFDAYTYDALGNVRTDTSQDGTWTYTYDADGQLTGAAFVSSNPAVLPNQNLQYTYDPAGNRISETVNGVTTTYAVNNVNEYTSAATAGVGTTSYQYDADGNLISTTNPANQTTSYTFNDLNQMTAVSGPGLTASYFYDTLGNRVSETVNGVTTNFQVDPTGAGTVAATFAGSGVYKTDGGLLAHYTEGLGLVSQVDAAGNAAYYDFNVSGNTVGITNAGGSYADRYSYLPFGQTTTLAAGLANAFTFAGQVGVRSEADGTVSMRARVYNPGTGQFLSNDPIGLLSGSTNVRSYVSNDPVHFLDPLGLCSQFLGFSGGLGISGTVGITVNDNGDFFLTTGFGGTTGGVTVYSASTGNASEGDSVEFSGTVGHALIGATAHNSLDNSGYSGAGSVDVGFGVPGFSVNHFTNGRIGNLNDLLNALEGGHGSPGGGCPCGCPPPNTPNTPNNPGPIANTDEEVPHDPNYIYGPAGFGDQNFTPLQQVWQYTILFENQPTAGFPAQQVTITQQLDANLNWQSFRLGSFSFGGQTYQVPANQAFYQTRIDLTQQDGFYVDVTANIDEQTGVATWIFTTIDPATGQKPVNPTVGFLPPDQNGSGAGYVSYTILPTATDTTGTVINAQATVLFDTQAPINTPQIFNTVDSSNGLSSAITPLPAFQTAPKFTVSWSGSDLIGTQNVGSAVSTYTIYVSDNSSAYRPWLTNTTLTSAPYTGVAGHSYSFTSLATDNSGDAQAVPSPAQTTAVLADHLVLQAPAQAIGGGKFGVTVEAVDPTGQVDPNYTGIIGLSLTGAPTGGSLSGVVVEPVVAGKATFTGLSLNSVGSYTLVATNTTDLLGASTAIAVAPTTHFRVTAVPTTAAGSPFTVTVTALDAHGNPDASYAGSVFLTSTDPQAGYALVAENKGVLTYTVTLKTAGPQTITAADATLATAKGTSTPVNVTGLATVAGFHLTGFPTSDVSGTAHSFTVTAVDAFGNPVAGYLGKVHFTSSDARASLPADYTFLPTDKGKHAFSATLVSLGNQTLTATDTAHSTVTGSEAGIAVASAATHLALSGVPTSATAGQSFTLTVTALTAGLQTDTLFPDTLQVTSSDKQAVAVLASDASGVLTYTVTLKTAGTQTLTVTDRSRSTVKGATATVPVTASTTVAGFHVTGFPTSDASGAAHSFTVTAVDAFGNPVAGYLGTVHFTSSDARASLPADYTFQAADKGKHTFSATLVSLGGQSITATDTAKGTVTGSETGIAVASAATHLGLSGVPTSATAGQSFTVTVTALTAAGQTDTLFPDTLQVTSSDKQAVAVLASDASGVLTYTVTLKTAGTQTLTVSDRTRSIIKGATGSVPVTGLTTVSGFQVSGFPTADVTGQAHSFTVTAVDAYGNPVAGYLGTVHFTSSDAKASLPADYTFQATDKGKHTFNATLVSLGGQSITAAGTAKASLFGAQANITVSSPATHLGVTGLPTSITAGKSFTITVTALDALGHTAAAFQDTIHFATSDLQAVLPADYTFSLADKGTQSFTITLETAGKQTITVTDTLRPRITNAQVSASVAPAKAAFLKVTSFPTLTLAGASHSFTVTAVDAYGNRVTNFTDTVHFTSSDTGSVSLPKDYTFTATDKGLHTFTAALATVGSQSLNATDTAAGSTAAGAEVNIGVVKLTAGVTPGLPVAVRGQTVPFTLTAGETGQPASTVFTYKIGWGDGSAAQTVTGPSGLTVSHLYTVGGPYTISVTATDALGNASVAATGSEVINAVAIEQDPADATKTALVVGGTTGNDTITLSPVPSDTTGKTIAVSINGVAQAGTFTPTGHILVYGQGGNDTIQEVSQTSGGQTVTIAVPAFVFAGSGNTTLSAAGSSADNVLVGGGGKDTLTGGSGRDILIGGGGPSVLHAGSGDDILIGGSTVYDANLPALLAIAAEWNRTDRTYQSRVQDLFGDGSGGLNGAYFLNAQTVARDIAASQLFGGAGSDWFWFSDKTNAADKLGAYANGEVAAFE